MPTSEPLALSLLENSHAFLREAAAKAVAARTDVRQWQFAILNLVQALELSLKAALKAIHPAFIFENIDAPRNTVTPMVALRRLATVGGLAVSDKDARKIQRAIDVRNKVTHSDFVLKSEYASATFCEVFAFVSDFQNRHLATKVSDVIPTSDFEEIVKIRRLLDELAALARARIEEEKIAAEWIWACPNCGEDTFVIGDGADVCFACGHAERVIACPQCARLTFEAEMESFFDDLDVDFSEGQADVHNDYGYSKHDACPECVPRIRQDIEDKRMADEFDRLEEEYRLRRKGASA